MSLCRTRLGREFATTGRFDWALYDARGTLQQSGSSQLAMPPRARRCEVVLAAELVLIERVSVPAAQQRRLQGALRFLAEDSLLPDPARVHVAAVPTVQKEVLCVGIVDREWLAQALGRLGRLGLAPDSAYPECLLPALEPRAWVLVCNGVDSFVRTGELEGFALDSDTDGEPPVGLQLALETARAAGRPPERIVVRAAPEASPPDMAHWSAALGIPVERGATWSWAQAAAPRFELLQGEFAPRGGADAWRARLRRPALLAAATLVLASFGIAADWALKAAERDRLQREMRSIYRESFGEAAVIVDPPLQMSRALADLRLRAGKGGAGEFVALVDAAATRIGPKAGRVESVTYEEGRLTVLLRARDPGQAAALAAQLRASPTVPGVELRAEEGDGAVRVTLRSRAPG